MVLVIFFSIIHIFKNQKHRLLMIGVRSESSIFLSLFTEEEKGNELKRTECSLKET